MNIRLVLHVLGVAALVAASLAAMADQSDRLVGVHEIPPFVTQRVELVPTADRPIADIPQRTAPAGRAG